MCAGRAQPYRSKLRGSCDTTRPSTMVTFKPYYDQVDGSPHQRCHGLPASSIRGHGSSDPQLQLWGLQHGGSQSRRFRQHEVTKLSVVEHGEMILQHHHAPTNTSRDEDIIAGTTTRRECRQSTGDSSHRYELSKIVFIFYYLTNCNRMYCKVAI